MEADEAAEGEGDETGGHEDESDSTGDEDGGGSTSDESDGGELGECGNGVVESGEQCDDGNDSNMDSCTNACELPRCGDGYYQNGAGEQCDDGNNSNGDACTNECKAAQCGDGFVRSGVEECDDGNVDNSDDCLDTCEAATCGDGHVWTGHEECDLGDAGADGACPACEWAECGDGYTCTAETGPAACDNSPYLSRAEECDDHNDSNEDDCVEFAGTCAVASCGDNFVRRFAADEADIEQCDDGERNGIERSSAEDTGVSDCMADCQVTTCEDGYWGASESCDDGDPSDPSCINEDDVCRPSRCGDGILDVEAGEQCDEGDVDLDYCLPGCVVNVCGDGEACTDESCGNPDFPTTQPTMLERCDDGNGSNADACKDDVNAPQAHWCQVNTCHDGYACTGDDCGEVVGTVLEACDDGNESNSDACVGECEDASCGDGYTCTEASGPDACLTSPLLDSVEDCDDGNQIGGELNGCEANCTLSDCLIVEDFETTSVSAWSQTGDWEIGEPTGACEDPTADTSYGDGNTVAGTSLNACVPNVAHNDWCLTSPELDPRFFDGLSLAFHYNNSGHDPYSSERHGEATMEFVVQAKIGDGEWSEPVMDWWEVWQGDGRRRGHADMDAWDQFVDDLTFAPGETLQVRWCYSQEDGEILGAGFPYPRADEVPIPCGEGEHATWCHHEHGGWTLDDVSICRPSDAR
ncbi:MAG: hypothetical protein B7733_16310 [Myxococcales bacterium FL481]|nr:MAG: hypothetical protein B7733_16310 [Myxococcales bacterium FL481]